MLRFIALLLFTGLSITLHAQAITGVWKGKMGNARVELKLIRKGDSLTGTSYYYESKNNYRRYSIKGYFDDRSNDVIWWDDVLLEDHSPKKLLSGKPTEALLAEADFNCPGEGVMKLDGKTSLRDDDSKQQKELHLQKGTSDLFTDEWDYVIANYAYGASDPLFIDSIQGIALQPVAVPAGYEAAPLPSMQPIEPAAVESPKAVTVHDLAAMPVSKPVSQQSNQEKFSSRTNILQNVITVKGDSIELRFYDNAEIDGDSIALRFYDNAEIDGDSIAVYLNGKLLAEHIGLSENPYIMKIAVSSLEAENELVMVAENLGSIPPNTSLMLAFVGDKRYEAHLQSTEGSNALVRLVKP